MATADDEVVVSLETFAAGLRDAYLACRELGHVWRPQNATYDPTARCYDRTLRCSRCKCERVQVISTAGHVLGNSYRYPDGYQARHVERGVYSRDAFRIESVRRYLGDGKGGK